MNTKILVLLSTYNGEKYLEELLRSLYAQKSVELKCIIRDDGSTDKTCNILKKFCETHPGFTYECGNNIGVVESFNALTRNELTEEYEWFCFCDQDDIWHDKKLIIGLNMLQHLKQNIPLIYCSDLNLVDETGCYIGKMRDYIPKITPYKACIRNCSAGCTMIFNVAALRLYRMGIGKRMEMHDYWMHLIGVYLGKIVYDDKAHIDYRQHPNNVVGAKKRSLKKYMKNIANGKYGKREAMLSDFLETYSGLLSKRHKSILKHIASISKSRIDRLIVFFDARYRAYKFQDTISFKLRVLINRMY